MFDALYYVVTHLSEPWVGGPVMVGGSIAALIGIYWVSL